MANNPQPDHISAEMWWFIEELERIEGPDTVFAGAWGDFKSGYHCDAFNLWWYKDKSGAFIWRNDYSTKLPDDKVLGDPNFEHLGAAVDWTFLSAQAGNFANFKKYGSRIRAAWAAHDPRLKGWREVLCQGDPDVSADGYDFVSWTERTPDATHTWHMHFSCLRKYLRTLRVFQAMISILKGETLAQWQAGGGDGDMATVFTWQGNVWISKGDASYRELVGKFIPAPQTVGELNVVTDAHRCYPGKDVRGSVGYPVPDLATRGWTEALVDLTFGKIRQAGVAVDLSPEDIAAMTKGAHDGAKAGASEAIAGATISGTIQPGGGA